MPSTAIVPPTLSETWRARRVLVAAAVACTFGLLLVATSTHLPIVWDEGNQITRAEGVARWLGRVRGHVPSPPGGGPFDAATIRGDWQYTIVLEGHPALCGVLIALGSWLSTGWLPPLTSARLGSMALFALAAGVVFYRLWRERSLAAAVVAVGALAAMPRLFAHAHFATTDGPLTAAWLIAWAIWHPALRDARLAVAWGIALGLALSAKFTGWLAPVPFLVWSLLYRDRAGLRVLALGLPVAVATFILLNPPLWHAPLAGIRTFLDLNMHRPAHHAGAATEFLGQIYGLGHPLPWYNAFLWTAITVPPLLLALAAVGLATASARWRDDPEGILVIGQWAMLLVIRALPRTPPYDAERLILPSFGFLAVLAGLGASRLLHGTIGLRPDVAPLRRWAVALITVAFAASGTQMVRYAPQFLSYYNVFIGGIRGATERGMEPTYYWDGLDQQVWDWLNRATPAHGKIAFGSAPAQGLALLQKWGVLQRGFRPNEPGDYRWYVIQRRPSTWDPWDRWLVEHEQPAYERRLLGVPLIDIYSYNQFAHAARAVGKHAEGKHPRYGPFLGEYRAPDDVSHASKYS